MTEPKLLQLIDRVQNDLDNNWAVDAEDIRRLLNCSKQGIELKQLNNDVIGKKYLCSSVKWIDTRVYEFEDVFEYKEMVFRVVMLSDGKPSIITHKDLANQILNRLSHAL